VTYPAGIGCYTEVFPSAAVGSIRLVEEESQWRWGRIRFTRMTWIKLVCGLQQYSDLTGKTVLLVDDVIYKGRTIRAALNAVRVR